MKGFQHCTCTKNNYVQVKKKQNIFMLSLTTTQYISTVFEGFSVSKKHAMRLHH